MAEYTITRSDWQLRFCKLMGYPMHGNNQLTLVAWMAAEGSPDNPPQAKFNPLNTTQRMQGSTQFNSIGVQNYVSLEQGLEATKLTLQSKGHRYWLIRRRLRRNARPRRTLRAVERSAWGTGGLARSIVDDVIRFWDDYSTKAIGQ